MIFAQQTFDPSKSFNGHGLLTLGVLALAVILLCNVDKLWNLYKNWKGKTVPTPVPVEVEEGDLLNQQEEEITEADYRVVMFGWIDDIRTYAIENQNQAALTTANKLINDLLATEVKETK